MSDDDMMARLLAMADAPVAAPEPKAKASKPKAKAEVFVPTPVQPEDMTGIPDPVASGKIKVDPSATIVAVDQPIKVPAVVLDDGSTFSSLRGCKIVMVSPDADEVDDEALANGVEISNLLAIRDAFRVILNAIG